MGKVRPKKYLVVSLIFILAIILVSFFHFKHAKSGLYQAISISNDDKHMTFAYFSGSAASIYVSQIDGKEIRRLTHPKNEYHIGPSFSPSGLKILFLSYPIKADKPYSCIFIMNADGTDIKQVTFDKENIIDAIFSSDEKTIYFISSASFGRYSPMYKSLPHGCDIYSIMVNGTNRKRLTNRNAYSMSNLFLSTDGKKLYFEILGGLFCLPLDSITEEKEITPSINTRSSSSPNLGPEFPYGFQLSPDNKSLAFVTENRYGEKNISTSYNQYELYLMNLSTNEIKQLTSLGSCVAKPRFFHNQDKILFMQDLNWPNQPSRYALMQVDTNGSNLKKIDLNISK